MTRIMLAPRVLTQLNNYQPTKQNFANQIIL